MDIRTKELEGADKEQVYEEFETAWENFMSYLQEYQNYDIENNK